MKEARYKLKQDVQAGSKEEFVPVSRAELWSRW